MNKIDEMRALERADVMDVLARLAYCADGGYNTHPAIWSMCHDAMLLINRLDSDIQTLHDTVAIAQREAAQAQEERDAAVAELGYSRPCRVCSHYNDDIANLTKEPCASCNKVVKQNWQWRGMEVEG